MISSVARAMRRARSGRVRARPSSLTMRVRTPSMWRRTLAGSERSSPESRSAMTRFWSRTVTSRSHGRTATSDARDGAPGAAGGVPGTTGVVAPATGSSILGRDRSIRWSSDIGERVPPIDVAEAAALRGLWAPDHEPGEMVAVHPAPRRGQQVVRQLQPQAQAPEARGRLQPIAFGDELARALDELAAGQRPEPCWAWPVMKASI